MKIAIEAQRIFRTNKHGMDFVALESIRELQKIDHENEYFIFVTPGEDRCLEESENVHIIELKCPTYPLWEQVALPRAVKKIMPDLLHCTRGTGGPGHTIKGEFSQNGVINNLKHTPGVLSMARSMMPDSAGSQFFIMHKAAPHLDGQYAAFGKIIEGMDVVNKIAEVATDYSDKPLEPQVMKTVTVEE